MGVVESIRRSQKKSGVVPSLVTQHSRYAICASCHTPIKRKKTPQGTLMTEFEHHFGQWEGDDVVYYHGGKCLKPVEARG